MKSPAGRKTKAPDGHSVTMTFRISPTLARYLRAQPNATAALERAIISTKAYREWAKQPLDVKAP